MPHLVSSERMEPLTQNKYLECKNVPVVIPICKLDYDTKIQIKKTETIK